MHNSGNETSFLGQMVCTCFVPTAPVCAGFRLTGGGKYGAFE